MTNAPNQDLPGDQPVPDNTLPGDMPVEEVEVDEPNEVDDDPEGGRGRDKDKVRGKSADAPGHNKPQPK